MHRLLAQGCTRARAPARALAAVRHRGAGAIAQAGHRQRFRDRHADATTRPAAGAAAMTAPAATAAGPDRRTTAANGRRLLRRYRSAESTRLVWRDVLGLDDVDATLAGSTALAEQLPADRAGGAGRRFAAAPRRGARRRWQGAAAGRVRPGQARRRRAEFLLRRRPRLRLRQRRRRPTARRPRPLAAEDYFARLGQQLAKLLDEVTADGFCHRVDLRLRPFGNAGRMACVVRGDGAVLPARRPRLGALCLAEGAAGRRRSRSRRALPGDACGRSCTGATSITARSTACAR